MTSLTCIASRISRIPQNKRRCFILERCCWSTLSPFNPGEVCRGVKTVPPADSGPLDEAENLTDQTEAERILKMRDISRLEPIHRNIANRILPTEEKYMPQHYTVLYNKRMFGRYGYASGVNPALCWPTKAELADKIEYEEVAYPYSIMEVAEREKAKQEAEERRILERDAYVTENYQKMLKMKQEFLDKQKKQQAEAEAAKEFKMRLIEEVRLHFNYTINERDERFKLEVQERAKQLKEKQKRAKKMSKKEKLAMEKASKFEFQKQKLKEEEERRVSFLSTVIEE